MATITLEYDGRNAGLKKLVEAMVALGATVVQPKKATPKPTAKTLKALNELKTGDVVRFKNANELERYMYEL